MKKNVINVGIAVLLLALVGVISKFLGVFDGIDDFFDSIQISADLIFQVILAIVFVALLENLIVLLLRLFQMAGGRVRTLSTVFISLAKYVAVLVGACWCLSIIGINISTIFASIGIVALILGFGAESLVADLVTGIFILFENQFNVGDIIEVAGFRGTVKDIGIRTTSLIDSGKNVKIINNSDLREILNRSDQRSVAVSEICVSYDTDLDKLEARLPNILKSIQESNADLFVNRVDYVGVEALGDFGITLKFVADVVEENIYAGTRRLNKCLKQAFDKEKVDMPYPQLDVHMK